MLNCGMPVQWYNTEHLHSAIRFVTPGSRHLGLDKAILAKRSAVYENARRLNPLRWSRHTRNWSVVTEVHLNPPVREAGDTICFADR